MVVSKERWDCKETIGIVPLKEIPTAQMVDLQDLSLIYKRFLRLEELCNDLDGVGLHAVQVGWPLNMYVARSVSSQPFGYYVNCHYQRIGDKTILSYEGCLSLKNSDGTSRYFCLERAQSIQLKGWQLIVSGKLKAEPIDMVVSDQEGIVHQHEIDHASNITIDKIGKEVYLWA